MFLSTLCINIGVWNTSVDVSYHYKHSLHMYSKVVSVISN
jgi:hypothetical protein